MAKATLGRESPSGSGPVMQVSFPFFERYPLLGAFAKLPGQGVMFGYFALIALLTWLEWPWLPYWLKLWSPLVEIMRTFFPIFDHLEQASVIRRFGDRIPVIHHLIMAGWLFAILWMILWTAAVISSPKRCARWVRTLWPGQLLLYLLVFIVLAISTFLTIVFGYTLPTNHLLFAFHRYDLPLFMISAFFYCAVMGLVGVQVIVAGLFFIRRGKE